MIPFAPLLDRVPVHGIGVQSEPLPHTFSAAVVASEQTVLERWWQFNFCILGILIGVMRHKKGEAKLLDDAEELSRIAYYTVIQRLDYLYF